MSAEFLHEVPVWGMALVLPVVLVVAWLFGAVARWILRGRAKLGTAISIVISILGTAAGLLVAGFIDPQVHLWSVLTALLALGFSIAGIAAYAAVAAHFQAHPSVPVAELLAAGESERVEYKSTARVNLHTGQRDEKMEQVIAKTICAFLNADGGTLLIGVDDAGTPLGLDADLATMKAPDLDRYELWLRDLLTTTMGQNAAALVRIEFVEVSTADQVRPVCVVSARPSPRPVYLESGKAAGPEFWLRSGNSTRQLKVNEVTDYVMHRWPLNLGSTVAAQLLAAVRFSEGR
jgi:hypothetical protein